MFICKIYRYTFKKISQKTEKIPYTFYKSQIKSLIETKQNKNLKIKNWIKNRKLKTKFKKSNVYEIKKCSF